MAPETLWEVADYGNCQTFCQCEHQTTAQGSLYVGLYGTLETFPEFFLFSEMSILHSDFFGLCSKGFGHHPS